MSSSLDFKLFSKSFLQIMEEQNKHESLWCGFYDLLSQEQILNGTLSEFLIKAPEDCISGMIQRCFDAFYSTLLFSKLKRDDYFVSMKLIDNLELVWSKYHQNSDCIMVLARLLNLTIQFEKLGYAGFIDFDRKWQMIKQNPNYSLILYFFLLKEFRSFDFCLIYYFLSTEEKKRICLEVLEHFNSQISFDKPTYQKYIRLLAETVCKDNELDDDYKKAFQAYLV